MNTQPLPRHPRLMPGLGLLLGALIATAAIAQEVLPGIPTMAEAIPPTLNVVNTRPSKCSGVTSWSIAHTTG